MADFHEIEVRHEGEMAFRTQVNEHEIILDAAPSSGGSDLGPRPKPLLLVSLASCTGMDVTSLLQKMRVDYDDLRIAVSGELTSEHPKYYHKIHISYIVHATDESARSKVEKAVSLSLERYCGVTAMLEKAATITHDIKFHSEE